MNERYDEQGRPGDGATPAETEQAEVSRLLAAASGPPDTEAMPPDVAARLDDVLAGLVAERTSEPAAGPAPEDEGSGVTDLASRRRKRWPALLVAAAAVSVVGLGVGNVLDGGGGMEAASTADDASAGGAVAPETAEDGSADDTADRRAADRELEPAPQPADGKYSALADVPGLRSDSLAVDVQRVVDFALSGNVRRGLKRACVAPDLAKGDEWLSVRFDREPAILVLRAAEDGRRTAEVFRCDDGDTAAAETTIEAP